MPRPELLLARLAQVHHRVIQLHLIHRRLSDGMRTLRPIGVEHEVEVPTPGVRDADGLETTYAIEWASIVLMGLARNGVGFGIALSAESI